MFSGVYLSDCGLIGFDTVNPYPANMDNMVSS